MGEHDAAAVSCAALVQIGLVCLGVFLLDRKRVDYLLFAIQVLTAAVYPLYEAGWLHRLGVAEVPVLAVGLLIAATVSVFFTHVFFGLRPCVAAGSCCVSWAWWLRRGPRSLPLHRRRGPRGGRVDVIAAYQLVTCVRLCRKRGPPGPGLLLVAWLCLRGHRVGGLPLLGAWPRPHGRRAAGGDRSGGLRDFMALILRVDTFSASRRATA
ncbi:MAG: hypothetical protein H6721_25385 [Sandaracinus sp.]|nr:hypothetical protein [Sandaracinus sp.]